MNELFISFCSFDVLGGTFCMRMMKYCFAAYVLLPRHIKVINYSLDNKIKDFVCAACVRSIEDSGLSKKLR